ncbi:hypothetical protein [Moorena producens]|uniref:hypothetical protein n=1 Tax=Moorena producens TaxID=1155739 RepID=UPI001439B06A|nr:hypothetical protein [Moorena producens]
MSDSTGLIEISSHQDLVPSADVVFVHGLGGDARSTWYTQGKRDDDDCWLGWLGKDNLCVNICLGMTLKPQTGKATAVCPFSLKLVIY